MTSAERIWAPTSEPFSTTTTAASGKSCFNRIAAASPDGPAPTITTSKSIASRAGNPSVLIRTSLLDAAPSQLPPLAHDGPVGGGLKPTPTCKDFVGATHCVALLSAPTRPYEQEERESVASASHAGREKACCRHDRRP